MIDKWIVIQQTMVDLHRVYFKYNQQSGFHNLLRLGGVDDDKYHLSEVTIIVV